LEHLDDPQGFTPDEGLRARVVARGRALRRRRRLAIAGSSLVVVLLAGVGGAAGVAAWRWDHVDRVAIHTVEHLPSTETPPDDLAPMTVLVVGSDERTGPEAEQVGGARADTMALVRLDPRARDATVLSLPRDLWVPLAGTGREGRLNSALDTGPEELVASVEQLTGVGVDHYVELRFDGFRDLVDAVGGVDVAVDAPSRDANTGIDLPAGCAHLDGEAALAWVRSRHLEQLVHGRWVMDPTSDLGRVARQQAFALATLQALGRTSTSPADLDRLTSVLARDATIDDRLDLATLRRLVGLVRSLDAGDIATAVVPVEPVTVGSAAVLLPVGDPASWWPAAPGTAPSGDATSTSAPAATCP
jgi:LCP family protein required for cell wall assembly